MRRVYRPAGQEPQAKNLDFDSVFAKIGRGTKSTPRPDRMDAATLAREFARLAGEFRVVPPDHIQAAIGHAFVLEMLERAAAIAGGLADLPDTLRTIEKLERAKRRDRA